MSDTGSARAPSKHEKEDIVLRMVYPIDQFDRVEHVDSPDFILGRKHQEPFGVEITELYESEAHARLHNRPTYFTHLISGGEYIHKDDVSALPISTFTITDPDGKVKSENVPGILTPRPSLEERRRSLAGVIRRKSEKHAAYRDGLSHVNLIIYDHHANDIALEDEYPSEDVLGGEVRSELAESPFREIFLINQYRGDAHGYRPLRMLNLLEQFKLFLETVEMEFLDDDIDRVVVAFRDVMRHRRYAVDIVETDGGLRAAHGGLAVSISVDGIRIHDFADYPIPPSVDPCAQLTPGECGTHESRMRALEAEGRFMSAITFPILQGSLDHT